MAEDDVLEGLNPAQADAVTHLGSPLLVVAGAGSGKTRVLTRRIAWLIDHRNVSPFEILAITFTNKAADEMKQRIAALVGPVAAKMWVSTFHSACVRILRREAQVIGFPSNFTIYDQADAVRLTGYVVRDLGLDSKRFQPRAIHAMISAAKNEGTDAATYAERASAPGSPASPLERRAAEIYVEYQRRLQQSSAMDFDDLLLNAVKVFTTSPDALARYQERFRHLLVDEYQDTNGVQNELVVRLAEAHRNITVVGDSDQCLPAGTMIRTPGGVTPIEGIAAGDVVLGTKGGRDLVESTVSEVRATRHQGRLYTVKAGPVTLTGTEHHIVPARVVPLPEQHVVYLMYRADRGYRVGLCKGERSDDRGQPTVGFRVRMNQEHGDALWVLKIAADRGEAAYWESFFAAEYGLPTACFHSQGRSLAMDDSMLQRLYDQLDTETAAKQLFADLDLHPDFPHYRPANGARRSTVNLTMFSDRRQTKAYHRLQWSTNRLDLAEKVAAAGFNVRPSKHRSVRVETSFASYQEALETTRAVAASGGLGIRRRMQIEHDIWDYQPLSHLREGMEILAEIDGRLETVTVDEMTTQNHDGEVYDLEVADIHNYVADGVLVHNSVYRFRGADIRNIIQFEDAFPDTTVVLLEQNYRSTQTILDAANAVIANNFGRKPKNLWTEAGSGDRILRFHADDEVDEAQYVAGELARLHDPGRPPLGGDGGLLPHQRPVAGAGGVPHAGGDPLQGHRGHPLLRPQGDQGRRRLPQGRGQPLRRGVGQADPQCAQAGHRRHHGGQGRGLRQSDRGHLHRGPAAGRRCRGGGQVAQGDRRLPVPPRQLRRDHGEGDRGRPWRPSCETPAMWPSWRTSARSRPRVGWRTCRSWWGWPTSSSRPMSSWNRSASCRTPTRSTRTTRPWC